MIDNLTIQRVKDAANVVDVISDFCELKSEGHGIYGCLCPFHDDRHVGSFKVSERKNIYTCFACGAHGDSVEFLMKHEGMSFPDAIRWMGAKYSIDIDEEDSKWRDKVKHCKPHPTPPPLPMLVLPTEQVTAQLPLAKSNTLCNWLRSLPWNDEQKARVEKVLKNYAVGGMKNGMTVFWQIDENGKVRSGKMMAYKADGHRDKEANPYMKDGVQKYYSFDWMHTKLDSMGKIDLDKYDYKATLFGMHLLKWRPQATINLVESEKTALICSIAWGTNHDHLWMATGGMSNLRRETLQPLIDDDRTIILYPDRDGEEKWVRAAKEIGYDKIHINLSFMREHWKPEDGEKADIGDVILRMIRPTSSDLQQLRDLFPDTLGMLIDKLDLTVSD